MNNLISDPTNNTGSVDSVLAGPRAGSRRISLLAALILACVVCVLPAHGQANGTPRVASGHPHTLWDSQDVAAYKASFATNPGLKAAFDELKAAGDKRIGEPISLPAHKLEADGSWTFPDYKRGYQDAAGNWKWEWDFNGSLQRGTTDVANLGMLYALTGDDKYAAYAKKILLALTDAYGYGKGSKTPDPHGYNHFEAYGFDGGDIAMFLAKACQGYDLIYDAPSVSAEDHAIIERDLFRPLAEQLKKSTFMYTTHDRWGMVCLYGIFIAGETLNDQSLVDLALYGPGGTKDKLTGGFMDCFKPYVLSEGVAWGAGTSKIDDQLAAASVLTAVAEVLWHRGVNLYGYQDAALKKSYDAALKSVGTLDASSVRSLPGINAYEYVFRHYQDARYPAVINQLKPSFTLAIGEHLPSLPAPK